MACLALPPLPPFPPVLPGGITIPIFTPPTLPKLGFCCNIPLPEFPIPAIALPIPFPAVTITALNQFIAAVQAAYDAVSVSCPLE
jgi:hypothetical protein